MASSKSSKSAKNDKKVFDVAKPGKAAPSASSKPVIVTNRPLLQDPMMVKPEGEEEGATEGQTQPTVLRAPSSTRIKIQPLDHDADEPATNVAVATTPKDESKPAPEPQTPAEEATPEPKVESDTQPTEEATEDTSDPDQAGGPAEPAADTETAKPDEAPPEPTPKTEPAEPATPEQTPAQDATEPAQAPAKAPADPTETDKAAAKAAAEHQLELQKMAESRQYYLPINQVEQRRNKRYAALGLLLIIILVVAWADIALDAGLINLGGIKPVTHFFNK